MHEFPNPSRWSKRLVIAAAAGVGFLIALYLALYQWGVFGSVWDPFFHDPTGQWPNGSGRILHSAVSRLLPVPDAFLGALAYAGEIILELSGGRNRWRRRPWIVFLFALVVIGMGLGSLLLVIAQGAIFHAWCFLCLCSAGISLLIFEPALQEPLASAAFLYQGHKRGQSVWRLLWTGESNDGAPTPPP
jgi:hypothetical protein